MPIGESYNHDEDLTNMPIRERGTYVSEELVLVRGPKRYFHDGTSPSYNYFDVLVLALTDNETEEYRRVGVGKLYSWDESAEKVEALTLVRM
jgi:hypothetical protein